MKVTAKEVTDWRLLSASPSPCYRTASALNTDIFPVTASCQPRSDSRSHETDFMLLSVQSCLTLCDPVGL